MWHSRFMDWFEAHKATALFIYLVAVFIGINYGVKLALRNHWFRAENDIIPFDGILIMTRTYLYVCLSGMISTLLVITSFVITWKERSLIPIFCSVLMVGSYAFPFPHHPSYPEQEDFAKNRNQYESLVQQTLELAHCGDGSYSYGIESACYFYEDNQRIIRVNPFTFWRYIVYVDQPPSFDQCAELIELAQHWYLCVDKSYRDVMKPL